MGGEVGLRRLRRMRSGVVDDAAVADLDDALRLLGDLALVGDEHDGVAGGGELGEQLHDLGAAPAVERAGGLIGEDDATAVHQRARDRHALLLAAGELAGAVVDALAEAEAGEQLLGAGVALLARHAGIHRRHFDVVARGGAAEQVVALEHEAEGLAPQARERVAVERGDVLAHEAVGAAGGAVEAAEEVHQRGLARTRGTHDGDELAGVDGEVDAVQDAGLDLAIGEAARDAPEFDERGCSRRRSRGCHVGARLRRGGPGRRIGGRGSVLAGEGVRSS